jgi:hypothetical protein
VIPNNVTNPTSDPMEIHPPVKEAAKTPPINAKGRFKTVRHKLVKEPKAI